MSVAERVFRPPLLLREIISEFILRVHHRIDVYEARAKFLWKREDLGHNGCLCRAHVEDVESGDIVGESPTSIRSGVHAL